MQLMIVSFKDGICRLMRARCLDDAIVESQEAIVATGRFIATIIDQRTYSVIGCVHRRISMHGEDSFVFIGETP